MKWTGHSDYTAMNTYIDIADEIHQLQLTNYVDFPITAFLNIGFTHHAAIEELWGKRIAVYLKRSRELRGLVFGSRGDADFQPIEFRN